MMGVLGAVGNLGGLFGAKIDHPLGEPRELKRVLAELPGDNAFRAIDEIVGWYESLLAAPDFPVDRLFDVVRALDDAAQLSIRRLARDYLHASRLSRNEENRLWNIVHGYWSHLGQLYRRVQEGAEGKSKPAEALKSHRPLLVCRLIAALGGEIKWRQFRYGPCSNEVWLTLGRAYGFAEAGGFETRAVQLYPGVSGMTTPQQEYLKVLVLSASSMDALLPFEIEMAERLVAHFLPGFIFSVQSQHDSVYWVDTAKPLPPVRLARLPDEISPSLRFFQPGAAHAAIKALLDQLERGEDVPESLNLGAQVATRLLLPAVRHLEAYWAPVPPQRKHDRHRVKHRMAVVGGLSHALTVFAGQGGALNPELSQLPAESWVVDNVSRGGFGAALTDLRADWLRVGSLLSIQPDGGNNWLLGVVRRYQKDSDSSAQVGIQTLAHQVRTIEMKPRTASNYEASAMVTGICLKDGNAAGEWRLVLPPASFDVRESMELVEDGKRWLLAPVALAESNPDYEIARYRPLQAD